MMNKRILIVGPPKSGKLQLVKSLTGSLPSSLTSSDDHRGLDHTYDIRTKYYEKEIIIWIDEFNLKETKEPSLKQWINSFCSDEAAEVRQALGAVIFTFDPSITMPELEIYTREMSLFIDKLDDENWDGLVFIVSRGKLTADRLKLVDKAVDFEYVDQLAKDKDDEGEADGIARIKQGLENFIWDMEEDDAIKEQAEEEDSSQLDEEQGEEEESSKLDEKTPESLLKLQDPTVQLAKLLANMKTSLLNESDVENYEKFTEKLTAAKENKEMTHDERQALSEELADELLGLM